MTSRFDSEGYLLDLDAWSEVTAVELAHGVGIELTPAHWRIIRLLRDFYDRTGISPSMRPLVKLVRDALGAECGNSIYLLTLFPGSPATVAAKIAGLPRPTNCV
jgi:tRNA 2-thiouridine synthesizing protein E